MRVWRTSADWKARLERGKYFKDTCHKPWVRWSRKKVGRSILRPQHMDINEGNIQKYNLRGIILTSSFPNPRSRGSGCQNPCISPKAPSRHNATNFCKMFREKAVYCRNSELSTNGTNQRILTWDIASQQEEKKTSTLIRWSTFKTNHARYIHVPWDVGGRYSYIQCSMLEEYLNEI